MWRVAVLACTGCNIVFPLHEHPEAPDAAVDAAIDAPTCPRPAADELLTAGHFYTASLTKPLAVKVDTDRQDIEETADVDTHDSSAFQPSVIPQPLDDTFDAPVLSVDGESLMVRTFVMGGSFSIGEAIRLPTGMWKTPQTLSLMDENGQLIVVRFDFLPGAPTSSMPRHMIVSDPGHDTLWELEEISPLTWQAVRHYTSADFTGSVGLFAGNLVGDELRMVFVSQEVSDSALHLRVAERTDRAVAFTTSHFLYKPTLSNSSTAVLVTDCQDHLYVNIDSTVHHVIDPEILLTQ